MSAFKAYDIRGIYNQDFNKEDVYKIGFFLSELLNTRKVLIGHDVRESSPEIFAYLCQGIQDAGSDVYDLGVCTTPMVYWATAEFGFKASVMITASHNPKEYNGLKISRENALPVGFDSGLNELERWIDQRLVQAKPLAEKGKLIEFGKAEEYLSFQRKWVRDFSNLNIAIDCSNGMASLFARSLFGDKPIYIYDELDGTFPNHEANPLDPQNIVDLQDLVKETKADLGVIFDGDADRVMFVDEKGVFISPDLMIAVLGHYFLEEKGLRGNVLQDIRTSKSVKTYIERMGGKMEMWRVGRAYAALKLREIDGVFGGELAGHYYFKDFNYSDSGLMACSIILGIFADFKRNGKKVSEVIANIATYANSGEINFKLDKKQEAMDALKDYFMKEEKPIAFFDFDGYRIEFEDWWFNVRMSNTEPYLRLIAEATTRNLLEKKVEKAKEIIESFSI